MRPPSSTSGRSALPVPSTSTPASSLDRTAAAAPSPNCAALSSSVYDGSASCRCSDGSSTLTTSTRADGSRATSSAASENAATPPPHPSCASGMRRRHADNPKRRTTCASIDGAANPVLETKITAEIRSACNVPASASAPTARSASASAWRRYSAARSPAPPSRPSSSSGRTV
jgi:hypothetical protein